MNRLLILMSFLMAGQLFAKKKPLSERSVEEILKEYVIVGDFSAKASLRDNAKEIFWRYPVSLPKVDFSLIVTNLSDKNIVDEFPQTLGSGRPVEHLNRGRALFLKGKFEEAKSTWLGAKARYGTRYKYHRRADYFIANAFLYQALELLKKRKGNKDDPEVRELFVNASTFLSWAYGPKKNIPDPVLDKYAPKYYYNLATLYYMFERWTAAYGAMSDGFAFLRRTGRKEVRSYFRRLKAELYIRNRDYLSAVQQLDLTLRQDRDLEHGSEVFARIADIYFDLNNFELAEDMYQLAIRLDHSRGKMKPWQFILRGECLFWLGDFKRSIKMMNYGLGTSGSMKVVKDLPFEFQSLASIRIADSQLALKNIEEAKLSYFRHEKEFRSHETVHVARLRQACLELPFYKGKNVGHARKVLHSLKQEDSLPIEAQELVWTCEMASYAQHDRSRKLVDRVRKFYTKYPNSDFLKSLVKPIRTIQSQHINDYFEKGDIYGALDFYEKSKETLFPTVPEEYRAPLFEAYVDINYSTKAKPFYKNYRPKNDFDTLRKAAMLSEVSGQEKFWSKENHRNGKKLEGRDWKLKFSKKSHMFVDRVLSSPGGEKNYLWVYELTNTWVEDSFDVACDIVYPVLQRIGESGGDVSRRKFITMSKSFISRYIEDMLKYETFCAYSVLEFELELFTNDEKALAELYLKRDFLPINQVTAGLYYSLAELNFSKGNSNEARDLWRKIVDAGDEGLPEVRYAKSRLDTRRTELDKLWK